VAGGAARPGDDLGEQGWSRTIARLQDFLDRWHGYPAAEDKLYAALVANAEAHRQAEQVVASVAELERAAQLLPARGEAWARLAQLAAAAKSDYP
jgi:alpha-D-ribose 1-methylphosphonate 5-triphosphate synthase subunit PhnG